MSDLIRLMQQGNRTAPGNGAALRAQFDAMVRRGDFEPDSMRGLDDLDARMESSLRDLRERERPMVGQAIHRFSDPPARLEHAVIRPGERERRQTPFLRKAGTPIYYTDGTVGPAPPGE